jgi:hypothetical protein
MRIRAGSAIIIIFNILHVRIGCIREFGDIGYQRMLFPGGRAPQAKVYGCWWPADGIGRLCIVRLLLPISLLARYM